MPPSFFAMVNCTIAFPINGVTSSVCTQILAISLGLITEYSSFAFIYESQSPIICPKFVLETAAV